MADDLRALEKSRDQLKRSEIKRCRKTLEHLVPMIEAASWVRWLDLEMGLATALREGNLIAAAVLARSLAEEALRGIAVAKCVELLRSGEKGTRNDPELLLRVGKTFSQWCLPSLQPKSKDEVAIKTKQPKRNQDNAEIEDIRKTLNDYVHPNYGSHRIVYTPSRSSVFEILGAALCAIYERFNQRCWLNEVQATRARDIDRIEPTTSTKVRHAISSLAREDWIGLSPQLLEEGATSLLESNSIWKDPIQFLDGGFDFTPAADLLSDLGLTVEQVAAFSNSEGPYPFYDIECLVHWCIAKSSITSLEAVLANGSSSKRLGKAIDAFVTLNVVKKLLVKRLLPGLIATELPVSTAVMARAMLEFHMVAAWMTERLEKMDEITPDSGEDHFFSDLERAISSVLIGSYSTAEPSSKLRDHWLDIHGADPLSLGAVMSSASAGVQFEYNFFSHIVHGHARTGIDLWGSGGVPVARATLARAITLVGMTCSYEATIRETPIWSAMRLQSIDRLVVGGTSLASAVTATSLPERLTGNCDFVGIGEEWDPIVFREELNYYEAFYKYCEERDIDPENRQIYLRSDEVFLDKIEPRDGCVLLYFKKPQP